MCSDPFCAYEVDLGCRDNYVKVIRHLANHDNDLSDPILPGLRPQYFYFFKNEEDAAEQDGENH